jgi:hypothetical protein
MIAIAGLSELGLPGMLQHRQILADHLTLFKPWGSLYPPHYYLSPRFSDLPTTLNCIQLDALYTYSFLYQHEIQ